MNIRLTVLRNDTFIDQVYIHEISKQSKVAAKSAPVGQNPTGQHKRLTSHASNLSQHCLKELFATNHTVAIFVRELDNGLHLFRVHEPVQHRAQLGAGQRAVAIRVQPSARAMEVC